jgi:predicted ATPase
MQIELSKTDVEDHGSYQEVKDHPQGIKAILYLMGLDLKKPYQSEVVTHRNYNKQIVTCERWVGTQRTDAEFKALLKKALHTPHRVTCYD